MKEKWNKQQNFVASVSSIFIRREREKSDDDNDDEGINKKIYLTHGILCEWKEKEITNQNNLTG